MSPARTLTYRVEIDTGTARQQAAAMRAAFEKEMRQVKVGNIAAPDAGKGRRAYDELSAGADKLGKANDGARKTLENLVAGYISLQGAQMALRGLSAIDSLGTQATRSAFAFNKLSGGSEKAGANLLAIQRAGSGTIGVLAAMESGTTALSLNLADTAKEFGDITTAARAVTIVSPIIDDAASAVSELGVAAANLSYRRLDQLGLSVGDVRQRIGELKRENEGLDESAAFLQATVGLLNEKYGDLVNSTEAAATAQERLGVAFGEFARLASTTDFTKAIVSGPFESLAGLLEAANVSIFGGKAGGFAVENQLAANAELAKNAYMSTADSLGQAADIVKRINDAAVAGAPGVAQYQQQAVEVGAAIVRWGYATDEQIAKLQLLDKTVAGLGTPSDPNAFGNFATMQAQAERAAAEQRAAGIFEQQGGINQALTGAAQKNVGTLGLEQTLQLLKEQKSLVDQAITELVASATVNPDEIALRLAEIQQQSVQAFSDAASAMPEIDGATTAASFDVISQALADLNQGFVDFLPNTAALREDLIGLSEDIAFSGVMTEQQAAQLDYLAGAAAAVGNETSLLTAVTDELGISFLASNESAASTVDAMYQAQASYLAGALTADQYAGVMAALGGQLLQLAGEAGVATSAILALNAAQGGASGLPGFARGQQIGNAINQRIETRQATIDRDRARTEAERAAKQAAAEQERAAKRAGKALEDGAKKAANELKSALGKVPGLFSRTQVTEQDMKFSKAGVYQDKADEYLRRLQAEVEQGKDLFADVSIEDARQSLTALGVRVAEDNQIAFEQFVDAYESGLLFADAANVDKYINKDAVQRELELQKKAQEGKDNVYKAFGVAIDDASAAAVAGISGGGGGSVAAGGAAALSGQLIPMAADGVPTLGGYTIAPTLDTTALQEQLAAFKFEVELSASTGSNLVVALGQQIGENSQAFLVQGQAVGAILGAGVVTGAQNGADLGAGLLTAIATDIAAQSQFFLAQGQTVGAIVKGGVASAFNAAGGADSNGQAQTDIAMGMLRALNSQFSASQNMFYAAGQTPAVSTLDGFKATISQTAEGAPLVTPLVTALNTQIRLKGQDFQNQGITIAQYVQNGLSVGFASEAFKATLSSVGESLYASIRAGLLNAANGGDLVESLGAKILADISSEVEAP